MSHSILYRKLFIKTSQGFIPMIEAGDNNVYDAIGGRNGRRSRDWSACYTLFLDEKSYLSRVATEAQMVARLELIDSQNTHEGYTSESFGSYESVAIGGAGNYKGLKSFIAFVRNGCKNALGFEELDAKHIGVEISIDSYYFKEKTGKNSFCFSPKTEDEYFQMMGEANKITNGTGWFPNVRLRNNWSIDRHLKAKPKTIAPTDPKDHVRINIKHKGHFISLSRTRLRWSMSNCGKVFTTKKNAEATIKNILKKFSYLECEILPAYH